MDPDVKDDAARYDSAPPFDICKHSSLNILLSYGELHKVWNMKIKEEPIQTENLGTSYDGDREGYGAPGLRHHEYEATS